MKNKIKRTISLVICFTLFLGLISGLIIKPVEAKTTRLAIVTEVGGTVNVKSAGGSRAYSAYVDMNLNQGDYITTGESSYIKLKIQDTTDELTIGDNAEVYISDLTKAGSGNKSKLKMWAGSMWASVKKLAGNDKFEVETPTAVMGVQGTQFYTGVSTIGETNVGVFAGQVKAQIQTSATAAGTSSIGKSLAKAISKVTISANDNSQKLFGVEIGPSQQFLAGSRDQGNLNLNVGIMDTDQITKTVSKEIIKAIVKSNADIQKENNEFKNNTQNNLTNPDKASGTGTPLSINNQDDLNKVSKNLDNLVGNLVLSAIANNRIDEKEIKLLIEQVNKENPIPAQKLDLDKVEKLDAKAGIDPDFEKKRDAELDRLRQEKEKQDKKDKDIENAIKDILQQTLAFTKLADENNRIKQNTPSELLNTTPTIKNPQTPVGGVGGNMTSPSSTTRVGSITLNKSSSNLIVGASDTLVSTLVPANADNKVVTWNSDKPNVATVNSNGVVTAVSEGVATITVTTVDGAKTATCIVTIAAIPVISTPPTLPEIYLTVTNPPPGTGFGNGAMVPIDIHMKNFTGANEIYAVEIHLVYELPIFFDINTGIAAFKSQIFTEANSVYNLNEHKGAQQNELIGSAILYPLNNGLPTSIAVDGDTLLLQVPLKINSGTTQTVNFANKTIKLAYIKILNKNGTEIPTLGSGQVITVNVQTP